MTPTREGKEEKGRNERKERKGKRRESGINR